MEDLFAFLLLFSLVSLIAIHMWPSKFLKNKTKPESKKIKIGLASLVILFFILFGISNDSSNDNSHPSETKTTAVVTQPTELTPSPFPSTKEAVKEQTYTVTKVIDGDTIEIEGGQRIRYIGINTPETVDPNRPVQCYGKEASAKNKELVLNKKVRLEKDVSETDKYGRLLRYVWVDDTFVNDYLVSKGYANASSYPPDIKHQEQFTQSQRVAKENSLGLWSGCNAFTMATLTPTSPTAAIQNTNGCTIKGNISTTGEKIYHLVGCQSYSKTKIDTSAGERWFCGEQEAIQAGWRKAQNC